MRRTILFLLTGRAVPFGRERSAIAKSPREGPLAVGPLGLEGDEQADRAVHGGPDKAVHHYSASHYAFWRSEIGTHPLLEVPGAFGENISTLGMTESQVCLGDRFRLGTALVEVSQGRQPCWKQGQRLDCPSMVARIVASGKSGWYYRVIEPGKVAAGDSIELTERPLPDWSVARAFALLIAGEGREDRSALRALAEMDVLAAPWRRKAADLLGAA